MNNVQNYDIYIKGRTISICPTKPELENPPLGESNTAHVDSSQASQPLNRLSLAPCYFFMVYLMTLGLYNVKWQDY
jgi:hypothetical protein